MDINYLKPLIEQKVSELGFELFSLTSRKEGKDLILAVVVDRVEPIDMNTISEVSNAISSYLDELDDGNDAYTLDVSSLGAEKPLKVQALKNYVGQYVNIHVTNAIEGANIFEGDLVSVNDETIELSYRIKTRVKTVSILLSNIYKARLAIKF